MHTLAILIGQRLMRLGYRIWLWGLRGVLTRSALRPSLSSELGVDLRNVGPTTGSGPVTWYGQGGNA